MRIGVPSEIREDEYRVSLTPAGTRELTSRGHEVFVERGAGSGSLFTDEAYVAAGARLVPDSVAVFAEAELVIKVQEPLPEEFALLGPDHVLFTYLHLAPHAELTKNLVAAGATCLAYETVQKADGSHPLLAPMSEIAGRLAAQVAANCLERTSRGKGKLFGGATGVKAANVVILGAGIAGMNAAAIASGMGAHTKVLDINLDALSAIRHALPVVQTLHSDQLTIEDEVEKADVVIGAVLVPGAKAPVLVSEALVKAMQPGSVIVDLSIDQGGCIATARPTTHRRPTYVKHGMVHYCVDNMASAVPITSTLALTNATMPYIAAIADKGVIAAARSDPALARGVNVMEGKVTIAEVAEATGHPYFPLEYVLPIDYM
jgi:alanine dehydrogenase